MPEDTFEALLEQAIQEDRTAVDDALRLTYGSERSPPDVEAFQLVIGRNPQQIAVRILRMIESEGMLKRFIVALRRFDVDLQPAIADKVSDLVDLEATGGGLGELVLEGAADEEKFNKDHIIPRNFVPFLSRAGSFRCRIIVDGVIKGSGALISPRLVLTAWHVISAKGEKETPADRRIEVLDSQGKTHPARVDYASSCHADEWSNGVPIGSNGDNHHDALVLRIAEPIGHLLGHIDLPPEPLKWADKSTFALVHFPEGEDRGIGLGRIGKNDGNSVRVTHELTTEGGSSGGPCFDLQGRFLGLHQGRLGPRKRLVPYNRFAGEPDFRRSLDHDCDPTYLWSLDNSMDGHLIIGRNALFTAADAMRGNRHDNVRGLWVQRTSLESDAGLSFTYEILDRYLDPKKHRLIRISPGLSTDDFIEQAAIATGKPEALEQVKNRDDGDASRIRALLVWLNEIANTEQRKIWLFIDNPSSGLIGQTQKQLGQFVVETLRHPLLRTVLTGCETYRLDVDVFSTLDMADKAFSPGYFREFIGRFKRRDVWETLSLIGQDIGMRWGGERRDEAAHRVLHPFKAVAGSHYSMKDMAGVADEIRTEVNIRQLFETAVSGG